VRTKFNHRHPRWKYYICYKFLRFQTTMRQRRQRLVLTKRSSAAAKSTARPSYLVGVFHDISREKKSVEGQSTTFT